MRYLIDTNILIYYFNGIIDTHQVTDLFKNSFNLSVITKIEFLGWGQFSKDEKLNEQAELFLQFANVYELSNEIAKATIEIRRKHKIKMPDAIIAATAIVNNYIIVTNNEIDFKKLDMKTLNPLHKKI